MRMRAGADLLAILLGWSRCGIGSVADSVGRIRCGWGSIAVSVGRIDLVLRSHMARDLDSLLTTGIYSVAQSFNHLDLFLCEGAVA